MAINWIITKTADEAAIGAYFIYTDFRVDAQGKDFVDASVIASQLNTEEARKLADEKFKLFFNIAS